MDERETLRVEQLQAWMRGTSSGERPSYGRDLMTYMKRAKTQLTDQKKGIKDTTATLPQALRALETAANGSAGADVECGILPLHLSSDFWRRQDTTDPSAEVEAIAMVGEDASVYKVEVPLPASHAEDIYYFALQSSPVGIEGQGDRVDLNVRTSYECTLGDPRGSDAYKGTDGGAANDPLHVPVQLPSEVLAFAFPSVVESLRQRLCPEADALDIVPYKFVMYRRGDFFAPHVDAMQQDPLMVGSLALQIPIVEDRWRLGQTPRAATCPEAVDDDTSADEAAGQISEPGSGELVFYPGRDGRDANNQPSGKKGDAFRPPQHGEEHLRMRVDLTSVISPRVINPSAGDTTDAAAVHDTETSPPASNAAPDAARWEQPARYAAWLGDVMHEVRRVETRFRAVVIYRMRKRFHSAAIRATQRPTHDVNANDNNGFPACLQRRFPANRPGKTGGNVAPSRVLHHHFNIHTHPAARELATKLTDVMRMLEGAAPLTHLGVVLRHPYPPKGLVPEGLKGGDALLYAVAAQLFDVRLTPCTEFREDNIGVPYRLSSTAVDHERSVPPFSKIVFPVATTDIICPPPNPRSRLATAAVAAPPPLGRTSTSSTAESLADADAYFASQFRIQNTHSLDRVLDAGYTPLLDTAWIQLGFGKVVGGGCVYGNHDCGTDWWYRASALIISASPSLWQRRLPLFWVCAKAFCEGGAHMPMARIAATPDIFMHVAAFL